MMIRYGNLTIRQAGVADVKQLTDCQNRGIGRIDSWKDQCGRLQSSVDYELVENDFVSYMRN